MISKCYVGTYGIGVYFFLKVSPVQRPYKDDIKLKKGMAVIMKNNKPRYIVVDFEEYDKISIAMQMRKQRIDAVADNVIDENMEAFLELAK